MVLLPMAFKTSSRTEYLGENWMSYDKYSQSCENHPFLLDFFAVFHIWQLLEPKVQGKGWWPPNSNSDASIDQPHLCKFNPLFSADPNSGCEKKKIGSQPSSCSLPKVIYSIFKVSCSLYPVYTIPSQFSYHSSVKFDVLMLNCGGVQIFFFWPGAGLTNRPPVRDSNPGAPLVTCQARHFCVIYVRTIE